MTATPQVIGQRRENANLNVVDGTDPFGEAPFYAAGKPSGEHINGLEEGAMICGIFRGLRESKTANASGSKSQYVCIEWGNEDDLQRVRLMAPTMLRNVLEEQKVENGQYVELTYTGEKTPISGGRPYHVFTIGLERTQH